MRCLIVALSPLQTDVALNISVLNTCCINSLIHRIYSAICQRAATDIMNANLLLVVLLRSQTTTASKT